MIITLIFHISDFYRECYIKIYNEIHLSIRNSSCSDSLARPCPRLSRLPLRYYRLGIRWLTARSLEESELN